MHSGSAAGDTAPRARARGGPMMIRHLGMAPSVHPGAWVAPTAVLSGQVSIGAGSCIMHGAILAAEGGPVQVGVGCVIMENAVLRGTPRHRLLIGTRVTRPPLAGQAARWQLLLDLLDPDNRCGAWSSATVQGRPVVCTRAPHHARGARKRRHRLALARRHVLT